MINLAPWRFRNVTKEHGGPIESIVVAEVTSRIFGKVQYESQATLRPDIHSKSGTIYGGAHGTGTSAIKNEAVYKSISEALERWAYFTCVDSDRHSDFCFDYDSSTTGMAAFPGLLRSQSREHARNEAIERWVLGAWWVGMLSHHVIDLSGICLGSDIGGIHIEVPWYRRAVVVTWTFDPLCGLWAYGFSCSKSTLLAAQRAVHEMERNIRVLRSKSSTVGQGDVTSLFESRLIHFATVAGFSSFERRLSREVKNRSAVPRKLFDGPIPGPWETYADVWRCVYELPSSTQAKEIDYFVF